MKTERTEQRSAHISQDKLFTLVRAVTGEARAREADEQPMPPGRWDRLTRVALERIAVFGPSPEPWKVSGPGVPWLSIESVFGPRPEPWKVVVANILARHWEAIGIGHGLGDEVALNPQPLPPRYAFLTSLAQTLIGRAELMHEIADATRRDGEERGIIIVGGYVSRFVDDICGNDFRFKWPFPWPRPNWFTTEVAGLDLVVIATQVDQAAKDTFNPDLRHNLADASTRLAEAGLSRMQ